MKRKTILNKQVVKRKRKKNSSKVWGFIRKVSSISIKLSLLLIGMAALSMLFLSLYQYLLTSPHIRLEQVIVTGVDEGIKHELIEISQLNADMSLLGINLNDLKHKMESHPWIRSVELGKHFPHTLTIQAEKEVPRAVVVVDKLSFMNRWGTIFKEADKTDNMDYPVITGISQTGSDRESQLKLASHILDILESETGPWSLNKLSEIHITGNGDISLYSISMQAVINIKGSELETKRDELKKIVKHLKKTGLTHTVKAIDMNHRDGAVISFKKG